MRSSHPPTVPFQLIQLPISFNLFFTLFYYFFSAALFSSQRVTDGSVEKGDIIDFHMYIIERLSTYMLIANSNSCDN
jgi:hypothetical protein